MTGCGCRTRSSTSAVTEKECQSGQTHTDSDLARCGNRFSTACKSGKYPHGFSGRYIVEGARELGVGVKPVWTEGITRVNVFLNAGPDTEYNLSLIHI